MSEERKRHVVRITVTSSQKGTLGQSIDPANGWLSKKGKRLTKLRASASSSVPRGTNR